MVIILDFDGTCVTHDYPKVGKDIGAVPILKKIVENGHKIILFTMRPYNNNLLQDAIDWFKENDIPLYGIQKNPNQSRWTDSPKAHGDIIIDDTALGCPLKTDFELSNTPFVDWEKVDQMLFI